MTPHISERLKYVHLIKDGIGYVNRAADNWTASWSALLKRKLF